MNGEGGPRAIITVPVRKTARQRLDAKGSLEQRDSFYVTHHASLGATTMGAMAEELAMPLSNPEV